MTPDQNHPIVSVDAAAPVSLALALEKSESVQAKVEACAEDLASANDTVKTRIAEGATTVSAQGALAKNEQVENTVQECAADLQEVNDSLARGIKDLEHTELALTRAREALAQTEVSLASAREEEKMAQLRAMHDATTGLPNRRLFDDRLEHAIFMAQRHAWTLAVMFIDLDRFKSINDTHGHTAGDTVLREVALRLLERARDEDTVCRNGGDEFLYLLVNPQGRGNIERIARYVAENIATPIDAGDLGLVIKASVGIAIYPDHGITAEDLIRNADTAMYCAKKRMSGSVFYETPTQVS